MIDLLSQIQLVAISFLFSFFFSFLFIYIFDAYLMEMNFVIRNIVTLCMFVLSTLFYFYLCLQVYDGLPSFYQILFLFFGVCLFDKFYYPYFNKFVKKRKIKTHKHIEKFKNSLYNQIKKMGGIFRGRSRKKRKEDYANY